MLKNVEAGIRWLFKALFIKKQATPNYITKNSSVSHQNSHAKYEPFGTGSALAGS